jgi:hypothetical protein
MRFFSKAKDGGLESKVTGYWLAEIKSLFSIALLRFDDGSRETYHSHAFDCISWVLKGELREEHVSGEVEFHNRSLTPVVTRCSTFHRVFSNGTTWVLTFRGPWARRWAEYDPTRGVYSILQDHRDVVSEVQL